MEHFGDGSFDIAHAVIEHVGAWNRGEQFAAEVKRVARFHYEQMPRYWYPVDPHFLMPFFH